MGRVGMTTSGGMFIPVGITIDKGSVTKTKSYLDDFRKQAEANGKIEFKIDYNQLTGAKTKIETLKLATGEYVKVLNQLNAKGDPVKQVIVGMGNSADKTANSFQKLANAQNNLNQTTKKGVSIFQDFTTTFLKMAKFNTINIIYDSLTKSMSNAITITKEFNDATTELRKVSDLEGESLRTYAQDLAEYGAEVGRTMTDMVNSATVFKRTGATDEEAKNLAKVAEMYRNVADNEISSAEAASFLVSQMKAFNIAAKDSIHIIDSVNSVANAYAVNTNDLQTALAKSAAAMATAGNTYEETIALVEAGTAVMQGQAGTVGNGLRTIAINIANLATKSDEFVAANGKVNISLKDERGEIRSTYEVLNDLSQNWNNLSRAEQNNIATTLAGKHKYIPRLARFKPI